MKISLKKKSDFCFVQRASSLHAMFSMLFGQTEKEKEKKIIFSEHINWPPFYLKHFLHFKLHQCTNKSLNLQILNSTFNMLSEELLVEFSGVLIKL